MAELKTRETTASVRDFLNGITDVQTREDCFAIAALLEHVTKSKPSMWGTAIVGFGTYHYVYASGREGDWFRIGFSPRKQNITLYVLPSLVRFKNLLTTLGTHKVSGSCLHIKRLSDVHLPTLKKLIVASGKELDTVIKARKAELAGAQRR